MLFIIAAVGTSGCINSGEGGRERKFSGHGVERVVD
jgi:hypothetical protein